MSDMNYEEAWNALKEYIREHLRVLTKIKDLHTFYDIPVVPEDDGAIEMAEKTVAFIEDAERDRESSDMNCYALWSSLRGFLTLNYVTDSAMYMCSEVDSEERLHAAGAMDAATAILEQMEMIKKEMTATDKESENIE